MSILAKIIKFIIKRKKFCIFVICVIVSTISAMYTNQVRTFSPVRSTLIIFPIPIYLYISYQLYKRKKEKRKEEKEKRENEELEKEFEKELAEEEERLENFGSQRVSSIERIYINDFGKEIREIINFK